MKKFLIAMIAVCAAAPLAAQEVEPPPIVEAAHNRVAAFLDLTEDQVAEWDVIYQIHRDAEKPLKDEIGSVQAEIDALFEGFDPDPAEVHVVYHEAFVAVLDETQMWRLKFIARADDVQQIIPAFKLFELIPRR